MSKRPRRKVMLDWGRWQAVLKHTRQSSKPSTVAVLVAMENVCFEQREKHGGNAFAGSYPFLASMSGVHEDTVRNVVELLEAIGVIRVTSNYDVRRKQYSENYYTLLLIGGGTFRGGVRGGVMESEGTAESVALSKEKGEASKCPAADAASPLALRHFDASPQKRKTDPVDAEAAAKYRAEQAAAAEKRKRQQEAELAERKERERIEKEQRSERLRLAEEKRKADDEAAKLAEDARRLAMRTDVSSCVAAIGKAVFDEYDPGTLPMMLRNFEGFTVQEAVNKLRPDMSDKVRACMKNNEWDF